jgi:hypothetical protein
VTIRLRAHHLLCLTTYVGRGYTPAFTDNYDALVLRLMAGEPVELVEGPDDICQPLLKEDAPHCHNESVIERDRLAAESLFPLLTRDAEGRLILSAELVLELRTAFRGGDVRQACAGCEWSGLCDSVAGSGFDGVRLT